MEKVWTAEGSSANTATDDLLDNFEVFVDEDSEPADWDDALASFLIAFAKQEMATS